MRNGWILGWLGWMGCSGSGLGDGPPSPGDTDALPTPAVETSCDDALDDDGDGLVDCDDPDCADQALCAWPTGLQLDTRIDYVASDAAWFAGYDDCTILTAAALTRDRDQIVPGTDRVFCGAFSYGQDTCPAEFERPAAGCFGLAFGSPNGWPFQVRGNDGQWAPGGMATPDGSGGMRFSATVPLVVEGFNAGDLMTTVRFAE